MKYLEIKSYVLNDVRVVVKLDYQNQTISLVEVNDRSTPVSYPPKQWIFSNREVQYMDGWIAILDAMKLSVKEAKKEMEAYLAAEEKAKEELIIAIAKEEGKNRRR